MADELNKFWNTNIRWEKLSSKDLEKWYNICCEGGREVIIRWLSSRVDKKVDNFAECVKELAVDIVKDQLDKYIS